MREIVVNELSKSFSFYVNTGIFKRERRNKQAVTGITFFATEGDVVGIVGANGAGKTTIVKMLAGVLKPDSGSIQIDGEDPFNRSLKYRNSVSITFGQKGKLHPDMSILESAELYGSMYGLNADVSKKRIKEIGKLLFLTEDEYPKQARALSLGQRMKGEICLSIINRPKIVFLDEPTLGLDISSTRCIRAFLKQYCIDNSAIAILTSHDLADITETCSKLLVIEKGKSVFWGAINDLPSKFENNVTIDYSVKNNELVQIILSMFPDTINNNGVLSTSCKAAEVDKVLNALYNIGEIVDLKIEDKPIERILEELMHV